MLRCCLTFFAVQQSERVTRVSELVYFSVAGVKKLPRSFRAGVCFTAREGWPVNHL